jgi:hypothetical protein
LSWLAGLNESGLSFEDIEFSEIVPQSGYWVNNPDVLFESEIPIASKDVKASKSGAGDRAIFRLFFLRRFYEP